MNIQGLPYDIELIINKNIHELKMIDIKKEIKKNFKQSYIYTLTWKGHFNLFEAYNKVENDNYLTLFFKNKLKIELTNIYLDILRD